MEEKYRNDTDKEYKKCIFIEKKLLYIYFISIVFSIFNVYIYNLYIMWALIIINIIYITFSFINDLLLKNNAESERRNTMISNAFNINITSNKTNKYYNNNFDPSIKKLGVNCFESTLYTKINLLKMIPKQILKILFIIIMWTIIIFNEQNINLLLLLTQVFFSTEILFGFIKLIYYYIETCKLYDDFYYHFVTKKYSNKNDMPVILNYVVKYECLKNYCHILLSEKVFLKIKDNVEVLWNDILSDIK